VIFDKVIYPKLLTWSWAANLVHDFLILAVYSRLLKFSRVLVQRISAPAENSAQLVLAMGLERVRALLGPVNDWKGCLCQIFNRLLLVLPKLVCHICVVRCEARKLLRSR